MSATRRRISPGPSSAPGASATTPATSEASARRSPISTRYAELTGVEIPPGELLAWEVLGNCKWAIGALTQARRHLRGDERSVELAILGRLAAEMEYELLDLIERAA